MSSYGTIPTSTPPPDQALGPATEFVSRAKERIRTGLGTRRPWHEVLVSLSLPANFNEALARLSINLNYFHMNYAILTVFTLFLSLLWHPGTLIVFLIMFGAWLFLYFLRDDPVVVFGKEVDDVVVLIGLCGVTFLMLVLTHASYNIGVGVGIGVVLALVHATFRATDDLFLHHINVDDGGATMMRQTA